MFSCKFCEISKSTFLYRTPLVAAFVNSSFENAISSLKLKESSFVIKGTIMQIEEALINDRSRVSKVYRKFRIPTTYNFAVIYP